MSELEDLDDLADQLAFGTNRMPGGPHHHHRPVNPATARCGSPDHMKPGHVRVFRKNGKGKLRTVCRLCDAKRRKEHRKARNSGGYSAEGYPL